ncbi:nicotinate-nucleotide--dimethylbenzimidazole phosphoribosyltransferase [Vibrio spartinae]|uniref:Nicotinate-nucleotide--dimethylbenzimidazole phosphoribosyltransferase n=1 Tax=Vibrio spartinae TaxID=1918945 RepID=A0A1N6M6J9_9VIBR|nr:nicotinate-nucleotide--dimethylbenzimidazole phosphoribosyltransferase [Vibrio spartinae]QMV14720.1 Nicotinate-nucleotide--dimethylbenzimidazole phosphoribosyltransferase [Vibrio spartinae]SIO95000.1 Nicotinate-nucleotide--dimethylbenzimidazole phosphoribosyltransferase [Vibrio spartinae]
MLDTSLSDAIQNRIDQKTKPLGALGKLEAVAHQLALIQSQGLAQPVAHICINQPTVLVFAGDHGIADEGVSIAPSAVTQQMVLNFLAGGAGVNCFCRANQVALKVIDTGILLPVESESEQLIVQRLGERTGNLAKEPAMTMAQVEQGITLGRQVVLDTIQNGSNLVMFGEMGIGNTSSAAAILAALSDGDVESCVGLGTGISPQQYRNKVALVAAGAHRAKGLAPKAVLAEVGGFEIVQIVGAFLAAAEQQIPVLVDGFIVTVAALVATQLQPTCREFMIFAHHSQESGHQRALAILDANPLLDLDLRLGEGTGAVLAVPLVRAAAEFYNTMASFAEAGVEVTC